VVREFWLERWGSQELGFHQPDVNPGLRERWPVLTVPDGAGVFVPLCGKSLDMRWLADRGHRVFGVELAESAVRAFYEESQQPCQMVRMRRMQQFHGVGVTIYCGDFMELTALHLPGVSAVYDRAALIALPPKMRAHYADHLLRIVPDGCLMLLLTLEYDQKKVPGPPHSVSSEEVEALFGARCRIESTCRAGALALPAKFAEAGVEATEVVYELVKKF
jgi:thiopurine S-methyltransferase